MPWVIKSDCDNQGFGRPAPTCRCTLILLVTRAAVFRFPCVRIVAIETGGCPHAAIREDISANLMACETLTARHQTDIVLVESGGGTLQTDRRRADIMGRSSSPCCEKRPPYTDNSTIDISTPCIDNATSTTNYYRSDFYYHITAVSIWGG